MRRSTNGERSGLSGRTDIQRPQSEEMSGGIAVHNGSAMSTPIIGGGGSVVLATGSAGGSIADSSGAAISSDGGAHMSNSNSTISQGNNNHHDTHMANSMGMHDVPYYLSDRRNGMANKLRGVLQTMKAKNHRLGELNAQFRSRLPADEILRLLARVLQDMGSRVTPVVRFQGLRLLRASSRVSARSQRARIAVT